MRHANIYSSCAKIVSQEIIHKLNDSQIHALRAHYHKKEKDGIKEKMNMPISPMNMQTLSTFITITFKLPYT